MSWRAIQDTVSASESLADLSDFGERLYWRILAQADPWGRLPGSPAKVRALCVPLLPHATTDLVAIALDELANAGRVETYTVEGKTYLEVVDFAAHQPADVLGREGRRYKSRFPAPHAEERGANPRGREPPDFQGTPRDADKRGVSPAESESESESESELLAATAGLKDQPDELPSSHNLKGNLDLDAVASQLEDADKRTAAVLTSFARRGLPEAAFHNALEALKERKQMTDRPPLESEVRYFVGALKRMEQEGQYARA